MRYYVETTAYDFDLFTPKKRKDIKNENIKNFKNKRNRKRVSKTNGIVALIKRNLFLTIISITALLSVIGGLYFRAEINEISIQISKTENAITEKESELKVLETELNNLYSYKNIEDKAKENGMEKVKKHQVNYINVPKDISDICIEIRDN